MSPSLKAFLALVFVAVMGAVLIRPILNSTDVEPAASPEVAKPSPKRTKAKAPAPTPTPKPAPSPEPSPTSTPEDGLVSGPFRAQPLVTPYPLRCLNRSAGPPLPGLIASVTGGRLTVGYPDGRLIDSARLLRVVGYDYSERGLAGVQSRNVFVDNLLSRSPRRYEDHVAWAFTPITNCALRLDSDGTLRVEPNRGNSVVLARNVETFAISPDGRTLALVLEEGETTSLWVADLKGAELREVQRQQTGPRVTLHGWSPDARTIYASFARGSGLSFVRFPRASAPPLRGDVVASRVVGLEQCTDRLLGIANGAIAEITTQGPNYLTETGSGYTSVSCAPNGGFLAAIRDGNLLLLDGEGRELRDLTADSGLEDVYVDWGNGGAGLLLGRVPSGGGPGQIWHIAEGGAARDTGLTFTPGPAAIEWSASPPTGLPVR